MKVWYAAIGLKVESLYQEEYERPLEAESAFWLTDSKELETLVLNHKKPNSASTRNKHGRGSRAPDKNTAADTVISVKQGLHTRLNFWPKELSASKWVLSC